MFFYIRIYKKNNFLSNLCLESVSASSVFVKMKNSGSKLQSVIGEQIL